MNARLPLSRRDVIASRLATGQSVLAAELAVEFEISEDAIRRDLRALAADGKCRRVYGGALPLESVLHPNSARAAGPSDRARMLAKTAAGMIERGEFVFLDGGSINREIADLLPRDAEIAVATNSPDIAAALIRRADIPLVMVGGAVNLSTGTCIDAEAIFAVESMNIDRCFIGACSVASASCVGVRDYADALFKKSLIKRSSHRHAFATSESFQEHGPHRIAEPADVDSLIVDNELSEGKVVALRSAGFELLRAGVAVLLK
ncbi:DeoR/GlpR family DNA-binding transcription regulator [Sinorhizobium americanum]|uniref:DeoR family transcriptional regulator n=1 Tax=Sinorhizobium americanum TaxID=194963 RepID=A0A4R2B7W9_9HYPH|nr:DeoR/GlpR family DNA-binding transcription regulator [Sinorhizobium americanum]TCN22821.1 DeoR family transcriptional regulator [Sinorhizobium americanum]